jgi:hypothetical protein
VRRARPWWLALAAAATLGAAGHVDAGPMFSLPRKALEADVIVELEQPPAADPRQPRPPARVARVLLGDVKKARAPDIRRPKIALNVASACYPPDEATKPRRSLEFTSNGLEHRMGAYTSLNPDYDQIVEAVVNVAYWRQQAATQKDWTHEVDAVTRSTNRYFRYLGALFLTKQAPGAAARLEPLTHADKDVDLPKLPCFRNPGP